MSDRLSQKFAEIWLVDFEFSAPPGERPKVVCLVALEALSGRRIRVWADDLEDMEEPPYGVGEDCLFVAYYASAELGCHLVLDWELPVNVLDLFVEFRNLSNGLETPRGAGLLGALAWYGLPSIDSIDKDAMRSLIVDGGPWSTEERRAILDYCETDVDALSRLLPLMAPNIDWDRALLRGRYMKAAAHIENNGIPVDVERFNQLRMKWDELQEQLIWEVDKAYGVFEGRRFSQQRFARWLASNGIPWPLLESGRLDLTDATFRERAAARPELAELHELRVSLSQMRLSKLSVGCDGRNRCLLSAFRSRTGRNQPSNSRFIFGPAVWLRGLIRPQKGFGIAYIDWSQQEFGIAAALSGDKRMQRAYESGDPYLEFAKQAGAAPEDATKESHKAIRDQYKACVLAVQYGMGEQALAQRLELPVVAAKRLLEQHRSTYQAFWEWSDGVLDHAMLNGEIWTVFGWRLSIGDKPNPRSIRNFPMQANGAEMLRLASCLATEAGISVCAPVHDALLIEAPVDSLDEAIHETQHLMWLASETVLGGFQLRSDAEVFRYPDRYADARGTRMWGKVLAGLGQLGRPDGLK